jgi:hypothetical protein
VKSGVSETDLAYGGDGGVLSVHLPHLSSIETPNQLGKISLTTNRYKVSDN